MISDIFQRLNCNRTKFHVNSTASRFHHRHHHPLHLLNKNLVEQPSDHRTKHLNQPFLFRNLSSNSNLNTTQLAAERKTKGSRWIFDTWNNSVKLLTSGVVGWFHCSKIFTGLIHDNIWMTARNWTSKLPHESNSNPKRLLGNLGKKFFW